jgi:hypothetical protein
MYNLSISIIFLITFCLSPDLFARELKEDKNIKISHHEFKELFDNDKLLQVFINNDGNITGLYLEGPGDTLRFIVEKYYSEINPFLKEALRNKGLELKRIAQSREWTPTPLHEKLLPYVWLSAPFCLLALLIYISIMVWKIYRKINK